MYLYIALPILLVIIAIYVSTTLQVNDDTITLISEESLLKQHTTNNTLVKKSNNDTASHLRFNNNTSEESLLKQHTNNFSITITKSRPTIATNTLVKTNNNTTSHPKLVLHIGPHKTGTSSLQCDLSHYQNDLYKKASVVYLGRIYSHCINRKHRLIGSINTRALINDCLSSKSSTNCTETKVWKSLENQIAHFSKQNTSIIISDEAFSRIPASNVNSRQMLYNLFDKYYPGRVVVVLYYRRYYEWMLSMHNEGKPYHNEASHPYKERFKKWPSEGGSTCETFLSFMSRRLTNTTNKYKDYDPTIKVPYHDLADAQNIHLTRYLQKLWSNHSSLQLVLNSHEMKEGDSTVNFLRSVFPSHVVGDTLVKAKTSDGYTPFSNPSKSFDYDLLAVAAHNLGLVIPMNKKLTRPTVAALLEKHLLQFINKTTDDLPFQCLNDIQLQVFLNRSIEYEKQMYPDQAEDVTRQHKAAFIEASKKKKFCNLDHDRLLADTMVQDFFKRRWHVRFDEKRKITS